MSTDFPEQFFNRQDETADEDFYAEPRLVTHIDDLTIQSLTRFYREQLSPGSRVLDLMSSWISHLPEDVNFSRVSGLGMNAVELEANPRLDDYAVQNLNSTPKLPFDDDTFDAVLIAVSIQYLVQPVAVMTEIQRCLAPGESALSPCPTGSSRPRPFMRFMYCQPLSAVAQLHPIWRKAG